MDTEQKKAAKCPECGTSPLRFNYSNQVIPNGAVIALMWCADCGHTFTVSQIGQMPPKVSRLLGHLPPMVRGHG